MNSDFVTTQIGLITELIGDILSGGIPLILVIFAALVGLGISIRYVMNLLVRDSALLDVKFTDSEMDSWKKMSETEIIMNKSMR